MQLLHQLHNVVGHVVAVVQQCVKQVKLCLVAQVEVGRVGIVGRYALTGAQLLRKLNPAHLAFGFAVGIVGIVGCKGGKGRER